MRYILKWLKKQTIEKKLMFLNLIGISLAFIPMTIILMSYEYFSLKAQVLQESRIESTVVGESVAAAMAFRDEKASLETLTALKNEKSLVEVHLILSDGTLLQSYGKKKEFFYRPLKVTPIAKESFEGSLIIVEQPIYLRNEFVGSIKLVKTLKSFYDKLTMYWLTTLLVFLIGFLLARWVAMGISRMITEPLLSLTNITKKIMQEEDYKTPILIDTNDEIGSLARSFSQMMSQIRSRDKKLKNLAYYDKVTGIQNRHFFEERIKQMIYNAQKYKTQCHLMMIDLDDFKIVNDTLGHHIGDLLLKHVSEQLTQALRSDDTIFRIGGDEFAVLVDTLENEKAVGLIAQKIIKVVSTPVNIEGHEVKVGASIGISCFPRFAKDVITLMSTADIAMYEAKKNGKNSFKVYSDDF